jgi:hypothetical protein
MEMIDITMERWLVLSKRDAILQLLAVVAPGTQDYKNANIED